MKFIGWAKSRVTKLRNWSKGSASTSTALVAYIFMMGTTGPDIIFLNKGGVVDYVIFSFGVVGTIGLLIILAYDGYVAHVHNKPSR
jgi:hypothetical protein